MRLSASQPTTKNTSKQLALDSHNTHEVYVSASINMEQSTDVALFRRNPNEMLDDKTNSWKSLELRNFHKFVEMWNLIAQICGMWNFFHEFVES